MAGFGMLIAGGGPAGTAAAISLADIAPGLRIGICDRQRSDPFRIDESVPLPITDILDHLRLSLQFREANYLQTVWKVRLTGFRWGAASG